MAVDLGTRSPDIERALQHAPRQAAGALEEGLERASEVLDTAVGKIQERVEDIAPEQELGAASSRLRAEVEHAADAIDPPSRNQATIIGIALVLSLVALVVVIGLRQIAAARRDEARAKRARKRRSSARKSPAEATA